MNRIRIITTSVFGLLGVLSHLYIWVVHRHIFKLFLNKITIQYVNLVLGWEKRPKV